MLQLTEIGTMVLLKVLHATNLSTNKGPARIWRGSRVQGSLMQDSMTGIPTLYATMLKLALHAKPSPPSCLVKGHDGTSESNLHDERLNAIAVWP